MIPSSPSLEMSGFQNPTHKPWDLSPRVLIVSLGWVQGGLLFWKPPFNTNFMLKMGFYTGDFLRKENGALSNSDMRSVSETMGLRFRG